MKKIGLLALALVLALGSLGVGYAHWGDQLHITGDIYAGSLTIAFKYDEILDYVDNEDLLPVPKDVGYGEIYYDPDSYVQDPHSGKEGYKKLYLVVHNAYPCYEIHFTTIVVHNICTIPAHIIGFNMSDPTGELEFVWTTPPPSGIGYFWKDFNGNGSEDPGEIVINVEVVNFVCTQLEPCQPIKGEIDLHFKQEMEEHHTYFFEVEIEAVQWNKA
jgi:hypothetical protein